MNYKNFTTEELIKLLNTYNSIGNPFEAIKILEQCDNFFYLYGRIDNQSKEIREWYWKHSFNHIGAIKEYLICNSNVGKHYVQISSITRCAKIGNRILINVESNNFHNHAFCDEFYYQFNNFHVDNQFYLYNVSIHTIKQEMLQNQDFANYVKVNSL